MAVYLSDLDINLVPYFDNILDFGDPGLIQLRDVHQALLAAGTQNSGDDLHKGAKIHDPFNRAGIYLADFHIGQDGLYQETGLIGSFLIGGDDKEAAVIFNVDLAAALGHDFMDGFAPGADDFLIFSGLICMRIIWGA